MLTYAGLHECQDVKKEPNNTGDNSDPNNVSEDYSNRFGAQHYDTGNGKWNYEVPYYRRPR